MSQTDEEEQGCWCNICGSRLIEQIEASYKEVAKDNETKPITEQGLLALNGVCEALTKETK